MWPSSPQPCVGLHRARAQLSASVALTSGACCQQWCLYRSSTGVHRQTLHVWDLIVAQEQVLQSFCPRHCIVSSIEAARYAGYAIIIQALCSYRTFPAWGNI